MTSAGPLFVTGTDTDVGKTVVAAALTLGLDAYYWKPIQAGLEPTTDILAEAAARARATGDDATARPVIVGFAAETGSLDRAPEKAARKGVDLLVANDVAEEGSGFGSDTNRVTIVVPGAEPEPWPLLSKREVADRLLDRIRALRVGTGAE